MAIRMGGNSVFTNTGGVLFADGTQQTSQAAPSISPVFTGAINFSGSTLGLTSVAASSGSTAVYTGTITGGDNNAYVGASFTVAGFTNGPNNGTDLLVTASSATTLTLVNASAVAETNPATAATAGAIGIAGSLLDGIGNAGAPGDFMISSGPGTLWTHPNTFTWTVSQVTGAAPLASPTFTGTVGGITNTMVGADAAGAAAAAQTAAESFATAADTVVLSTAEAFATSAISTALASGTYGISISGNAATATNATEAGFALAIQAVIISATAPSVGQVLTATTTTAADWQTPAVAGNLVPTTFTGGTDAIDPHTTARYIVMTAGVDSMTIAAPTATTDDGVTISVTNGSSASHTITFTGGTLRSGNAGVTTATFGAFPGSTFTFYAYQGVWYALSQNLMASFT